MKFPWTLVIAMASGSLVLTSIPPSFAAPIYSKWTVHSEGIVKQRLATLDLPFEAQPTDVVLDRISMYVNGGRRATSIIMGRSTQYFPIYEYYLRKYKLPDALKYLPMIESGLRPDIRSGVGATGMWQLMYSTARHYDLTINDELDERCDPYRSTEAAVRLLADLYDMFGDWSLVLAAYNGGHNRVRKAIEKADCEEYEEVRKFLPTETQRYIPYFIAAAYMANFHEQHGISASLPSRMVEHTRMIEVHQQLSFREIQKVTGLSFNSIANLNPALLRNTVPSSPKGYFLVLPEDKINAVRELLAGKAGTISVPPNSFKYVHKVKTSDHIEKLAAVFQCTVEDIMAWNNLAKPEVVIGQELYLYLSKAYLFNRA